MARVAWAHVTAQDFAELNATDADTEGIVNHVRAVKGAQVGILFREVPGKKVRISLRAREGADVNKIANVFGGGGHKLAAGCSLEPPLADVEATGHCRNGPPTDVRNEDAEPYND